MRRTTTMLATAVLGVSLMVAGCGNSDETSAPTTTTAPADGGTETSTPGTSPDSGASAPSGGDLDAFCAVDAQLNSELFATYQPGQPLTEEQAALLEEARETAPDAVRSQVGAIVDALTGADPNAITDPAFAAGGDEIDAFVTENC